MKPPILGNSDEKIIKNKNQTIKSKTKKGFKKRLPNAKFKEPLLEPCFHFQ